MSTIESMENDIVHIHERRSAKSAELNRQRDAAELELESVRQQLQAEREELTTIVTAMVETVVTHKQRIQECIGEYRSTLTEVTKA
jgi:SMC interacting uncharacterized protein involved in chromosome segregation